MAENPSNGHAPNGQPSPANGNVPLGPRLRAPEGARSARAFDGSPIVEEPAETTAFDDALAVTVADEIDANSAVDESESLASNGAVVTETGAKSNEVESVEDIEDATAESAGVAEIEGQQSELELFPAGTKPDLGDDLRASFERNHNEQSETDAPPLGISIEKIEPEIEPETNGFDAYAPADYDANEADEDPDPYRNTDLAAAGIGDLDVIEGEQLFADDGAGGEPPSDDTAIATGGQGRPDTPRDQEAGLFEHLSELRSRLLYAALGVMAVMCITWNYALPIQGWFSAPINRVLNQDGVFKGELISTDPTAFFTLQFQSSLLAALILAAPWVSFQVWRFIEPALTNSERRYTLVLVPFSSILFFMGAALGYMCAPLFFQFFLQFQPPGVAAQWRYDESVILMAKMLLIFGLAFQVPIIIIFGNKIGLLSRNLLIEYWRHAVVAIFIVVAVLTPTWDPFTMTACALPPCLLYLLSIWLVKWL